MSAFGIWAIILTGIYLIYYPVVIFLDLFGKKGQKKDGVEVFDTGAGDEAPVMADEEEETPTTVVMEEEEAPAPQQEEEAPQVPLTPEQQQQEQFREMKDRIEETLQSGGEPVNPSYQQTLDSQTMLLMMNQPIDKRKKIKRTTIFP